MAISASGGLGSVMPRTKRSKEAPGSAPMTRAISGDRVACVPSGRPSGAVQVGDDQQIPAQCARWSVASPGAAAARASRRQNRMWPIQRGRISSGVFASPGRSDCRVWLSSIRPSRTGRERCANASGWPSASRHARNIATFWSECVAMRSSRSRRGRRLASSTPAAPSTTPSRQCASETSKSANGQAATRPSSPVPPERSGGVVSRRAARSGDRLRAWARARRSR